jgi:hypothetical protein
MTVSLPAAGLPTGLMVRVTGTDRFVGLVVLRVDERATLD